MASEPAGTFKWERKGYKGVLNSGPVQGAVKGSALRISRAATSKLRPSGPTDRGYRVGKRKGRLANGSYVATNGPHARRAEAKRHPLQKSVSAGRS